MAGLDGIRQVTYIPVSALHGDNVVTVDRADALVHGQTLLAHLETVDVADSTDWTRRRLPVQWVIRPMSDRHHDYRAVAGRIEGGIWRPGDAVVALPSGGRSRVRLDRHVRWAARAGVSAPERGADPGR